MATFSKCCVSLLLMFGAMLVSLAVNNVIPCPPGARFSECTDCLAHCTKPDTVCAAVCKEGCVCQEKGYRLHQGSCIPEEDCPVFPVEELYCPPGTRPTNCTGCWTYCPVLGKICSQGCQKGCECRVKGFVLHEGACILAEHCPLIPLPGKPCPRNMKWSKCSQCKDYCPVQQWGCDNHCRVGCTCVRRRHVLHKGECIPLWQCPMKIPFVSPCPEGTRWSSCIKCSSYCVPEKKCVRSCQRGCVCQKEGYAYHEGRCILHTACPQFPALPK